MAAWSLSHNEWDTLDRLRFSTTDAAVFRNPTIILTSAVRPSKASIAYDLGCSIGTVDIGRQPYRRSGLEGLIPGKPSGRVSRATAEYRAVLGRVIKTPPQDLSYGFGVWSLARLNAHLRKETGIGFSDDQLGRIMKQEGFSFQRPKHTIKGKRDEQAFQKAGRKLHALKEKPSPMTPISRWFFRTRWRFTDIPP